LDRRQSPDLPIKGLTMDKKALREETERLIREAMERKALVVKQGNTRIEACGKANRVLAEKGATRVKFVCKECGQKQETL
jgi:transposase-like protein